jgi:hypothetical protein
MDVWNCITEVLFSHAHEETDPVSAFPDISRLASFFFIFAGDERDKCDRPTVSTDFVATGIEGLADVMDKEFSEIEVLLTISLRELVSSKYGQRD